MLSLPQSPALSRGGEASPPTPAPWWASACTAVKQSLTCPQDITDVCDMLPPERLQTARPGLLTEDGGLREEAWRSFSCSQTLGAGQAASTCQTQGWVFRAGRPIAFLLRTLSGRLDRLSPPHTLCGHQSSQAPGRRILWLLRSEGCRTPDALHPWRRQINRPDPCRGDRVL